jgi:hypothetical protein
MKLNKDLFMKIFNMTLLAALISSPLAAETIDKTWELGVFGDYVKSSTSKENNIDWQQIEAGKGLGIDLQKIIMAMILITVSAMALTLFIKLKIVAFTCSLV